MAAAQQFAEWLRGVQALPSSQREQWLLRGSLLTQTLVPAGRPPADIDYLVTGPFDTALLLQTLHEALELTPGLSLLAYEIIWGGTDFPGVRVWLDGFGLGGTGAVQGNVNQGANQGTFSVDFGFHDPLSLPPRALTVVGVLGVLTCAAEDLWAWKLHGLVEFGPGRWRAKDLYDLAHLSTLTFDQALLVRATELAFASRGTPLTELLDLQQRPAWGQSFSNGRKWRSFCRKAGVEADLLECRDKVRRKLATLTLATP